MWILDIAILLAFVWFLLHDSWQVDDTVFLVVLDSAKAPMTGKDVAKASGKTIAGWYPVAALYRALDRLVDKGYATSELVENKAYPGVTERRYVITDVGRTVADRVRKLRRTLS